MIFSPLHFSFNEKSWTHFHLSGEDLLCGEILKMSENNFVLIPERFRDVIIHAGMSQEKLANAFGLFEKYLEEFNAEIFRMNRIGCE